MANKRGAGEQPSANPTSDASAPDPAIVLTLETKIAELEQLLEDVQNGRDHERKGRLTAESAALDLEVINAELTVRADALDRLLQDANAEIARLTALVPSSPTSNSDVVIDRDPPPLFLDATAHLVRDGELVVIKGGVLVEETDLTEDEIDELTAHRAIRLATELEIAAAEKRAAK